jgi:MFS family permease
MIAYLRKFDPRLSVLALGWLVSAIGFSLSIPFLSLYFHSELGLSLTSVGLFFGLTAIIRALFQAIGGELSDRFGRYYVMRLNIYSNFK